MKNSGVLLSQGYKYIIASFVISLVLLFICDFLGTIGFIFTAFIAYSFRDSSRPIFKNKEVILAPVDGTVIAVDFIDGKQKIYCKTTGCNTAVVRAPIDSNIEKVSYKNGLNLNPNSYKAKLLNEQVTFIFNSLELTLVSGICNPKIKYTKQTSVLQGDRVAVFVEGLAILTLDKDIKSSVNIGDKLISGQSTVSYI